MSDEATRAEMVLKRAELWLEVFRDLRDADRDSPHLESIPTEALIAATEYALREEPFRINTNPAVGGIFGTPHIALLNAVSQ